MMRKVFISVLVIVAILVIVPSVLAARRFGPGQHETLRIRVTLTSSGTDAHDNVLQGRGASVAFAWTATQA